MDPVHLFVLGLCSGGCLQSRLLAGPRPGPCQLLRWPLLIGVKQGRKQGWVKVEREREKKKKARKKWSKHHRSFFPFLWGRNELENFIIKKVLTRNKRRATEPGQRRSSAYLVGKGSEWGFYFSADLWDFSSKILMARSVKSRCLDDGYALVTGSLEKEGPSGGMNGIGE